MTDLNDENGNSLFRKCQLLNQKNYHLSVKHFGWGINLNYFTFLYNEKMEKEISYSKEVESVSSATSATKSLEFLFTSSSIMRMRLYESEKYCEFAENNLKLSKIKILSLTESKNKAVKTRGEMMNRDKINKTSLESLFQIQSELYNFKCDVKAEYIKAEKSIKSKKVKYEDIIVSYKSKWEEVEEAYKKLPLASELFTIQQQNDALLSEANNLNNLFESTKIDFSDKYEILMNELNTKILEFTKEYRNYLKFVELIHEIRQKSIQMQELLKMWKNDYTLQHQTLFKNTLLEGTVPAQRKEESESYNNLTDFDDVLLPLENLELQTEEGSFIYSKESEAEEIYEDSNMAHESDNPDPIASNKNYINPNGFKNFFPSQAGHLNDAENEGVSSESKDSEILSEDNLDNGLNETKSMSSESENVNDADTTSCYWKLKDKEPKDCAKPLEVTPGLKKKGRIGLKERRAKGESLPKRLKYSVENKNFLKSSNVGKAKILDKLIFSINQVKNAGFDKQANFTQETPLNAEKGKVPQFVRSPSVDDEPLPTKGNEVTTPICVKSNGESTRNKFAFFMDGKRSAKKGNNSIFSLF